jgi:hypothetical protein
MGEGTLRDKVIKALDREVYPIAIQPTSSPVTAKIVLSLIDRRKACGLILLTWLEIFR